MFNRRHPEFQGFNVPDSLAVEVLEKAQTGPEVHICGAITPEQAQVLFGKEWIVAEDAPINPKILELDVIPEQALVALADVQGRQIQRFEGTARLPETEIEVPEIVTEVREIPSPEAAFRTLLERLPLSKDDYVVGDAVACGIVEAVELKTPPVRLVGPSIGVFTEDMLNTDLARMIIFDPVCWTIKDPKYAGVNELARISAVLQIRAERIHSITTRVGQRVIENRMGQLGIPPEKIGEFLGREVLASDRRRLELMELALKAQLLAGRFALAQMIREGRPSKEVFFLAFCLNQFHTGGLAAMLTQEGIDQAWMNSGWGGGGFGDLAAELKRVQTRLEKDDLRSNFVMTNSVNW